MKNYLVLIKYLLSLTVAFSAAVGYFLYQANPDWNILFVFFGVFMLAGSSSALNQYQERKWDKEMSRTSGRPVPSGLITEKQALLTSLLLLLAGGTLLVNTGILPLTLGLLNIGFYNLLYTPLKRKTIFAILPGGLVGAVPPMIGWTAAGGSLTEPTILFLATLIFLWQVPHFWLLLIRYGKEYENAGFKSITKHLDNKQISRLAFFWIIISALFLVSYPLFQIEINIFLGVFLILMNIAAIIFFYVILFRNKPEKNYKLAFIFTNIILSMIMLVFILNQIFS